MNAILRYSISLIILLFFIHRCKEESVPVEKPKIVHNNSVEYYVETSRLDDGRIIVKTTQQIYVQFSPCRTIVKGDTLPALGRETVHLDETEKDTTIAKEYDIYFTLK